VTQARLRIDWQARSDPGAVRTINEDRIASDADRGIWAVADGMGGHANGDWAAEILTQTITNAPPETGFDAILQGCAKAIHAANQTVFAEATGKQVRMGSTVAALVIAERRFGVLWVGDSRIYLLRDRVLHQLTRDHTQVQDMVDRGLLSPESAIGHPMSHVLTRAIGVEHALALDATTDDIVSGDIFLLCSDGLYGALPDTEIAEILCQTGIDGAADLLISRALDQEARDNVTAIVVRAQEPTLLMLAPAEDALVP
jgi:serine/threonine protein phosphatase PrpC